MLSDEPVTTVPKSNGPATVGITTDRPNGAPAYGPVMNTLPPVSVKGSLPSPAVAVACPIRLSAPQVPCAACGSGPSFREESSAARPGGRRIDSEDGAWLLSGRVSVVSNEVKPPAAVFAEPAWKPGDSGSGLAQPAPSAPAVTANVPLTAFGALGVDQGTNVALVV